MHHGPVGVRRVGEPVDGSAHPSRRERHAGPPRLGRRRGEAETERASARLRVGHLGDPHLVGGAILRRRQRGAGLPEDVGSVTAHEQRPGLRDAADGEHGVETLAGTGQAQDHPPAVPHGEARPHVADDHPSAGLKARRLAGELLRRAFERGVLQRPVKRPGRRRQCRGSLAIVVGRATLQGPSPEPRRALPARRSAGHDGAGHVERAYSDAPAGAGRPSSGERRSCRRSTTRHDAAGNQRFLVESSGEITVTSPVCCLS